MHYILPSERLLTYLKALLNITSISRLGQPIHWSMIRHIINHITCSLLKKIIKRTGDISYQNSFLHQHNWLRTTINIIVRTQEGTETDIHHPLHADQSQDGQDGGTESMRHHSMMHHKYSQLGYNIRQFFISWVQPT